MRGLDAHLLQGGEQDVDDASLDEALNESLKPAMRQETIRTQTKMTSKTAGPLLTPVITSPFPHGKRVDVVQRSKAVQRRLRLQVALSCVIMFTEGFYATQLFPYGPSMTEALRGSSQDVGGYVGLLYTAQSVGMLTTSYLWAAVSNKYGRRFCLIIGLASNTLATVLISMSSDYWMTLALRLWSGLMNSNLSIMRTALRETFQHEDAEDTWAFSTLSVAFGASCVAGPSFGGFVYGITFEQAGDWQRPWSLAMLSCTVLYVACLVVTIFWMPETAFLNELPGTVLRKETLATNGATSPNGVNAAPARKRGLLGDFRFVLLLIMGGGHSYVFTGWEISYPLIARLPPEIMGENWTTADIGLTFLVGSVGLMLYSLAVYPSAAKKLSLIRLWCWSAVLPLLTMAAFPRLLDLARSSGLTGRSPEVFVLNYGTQVIVSMLMGSGFISIQLLLNEYVSREQGAKSLLSLANSMLVSTQALVRAVSPISTGMLFTLGMQSEKAQPDSLLSRSLPFDSLALTGLLACILCALLFDRWA
mmetsp:Transcript_35577/g.80346  ORF Transcript_35577/g.80346 Transcript_35577/m.80346 type:complete len:533 (+) Transcript_35577:148-1746(+)